MQSAHRFGFGVLFRVGTPQTRHGSIMRISVCDSGRAEASAKAINPAPRRPPPRQSPVARTRFKTLIYLKGFGVRACRASISTSKFLAQLNKTQDVGRATKRRSALQSLLSWCRAGRPNSLRTRLGPFSVHGSDEQIFGRIRQVSETGQCEIQPDGPNVPNLTIS